MSRQAGGHLEVEGATREVYSQLVRQTVLKRSNTQRYHNTVSIIAQRREHLINSVCQCSRLKDFKTSMFRPTPHWSLLGLPGAGVVVASCHAGASSQYGSVLPTSGNHMRTSQRAHAQTSLRSPHSMGTSTVFLATHQHLCDSIGHLPGPNDFLRPSDFEPVGFRLPRIRRLLRHEDQRRY